MSARKPDQRSECERVVILGGGIVGLCLARRLAGLGVSVILVERHRVGAGASGAAAGILPAPMWRRSAYQRACGASYDGYSAFLDELQAETGVAIESIESGMLYLAETDDDAADLAGTFARADVATCPGRWYDARELAREFAGLSPALRGGLFLERTARVHPPDLLAALRRSASARGVDLREGFDDVRLERVSDGAEKGVDVLLERSGDVERLAGPRVTGPSVTRYSVVVCAGAWTTELLERAGLPLEAPIVPVRGQMLALRCAEPPPCMLDIGGVYLIPRPDGTLWVGATVEEVGFDDSTTATGAEELLDRARAALPSLQPTDVLRHWAGLRPKVLRRGGPILAEGDVWVVAGHYRSGILLGPRDADLIAGRLVGRDVGEFSVFG